MGSSVFPAPVAAASGGIKSVQRGSAGGAGNVTISSINIAKSFVNVYGTTSSGTVSASFGLSTSQNNSHNFIFQPQMEVSGGNSGNRVGYFTNLGTPVFNAGAGNLTLSAPSNAYVAGDMFRSFGSNVNGTSSVSHSVNAGSNNLVAAVVQGFLANSTTLTVSGACRWEVVEFA